MNLYPKNPAEEIEEALNTLDFLCTQSNFALVAALAKQKIDLDRNNWDYIELPTSHLPMVTHPDELNKLLEPLGSPTFTH